MHKDLRGIGALAYIHIYPYRHIQFEILCKENKNRCE